MEKLRPKGKSISSMVTQGQWRNGVLSPRSEPLPLSHVTWVMSLYGTFSHLPIYLSPCFPTRFLLPFQLCTAGSVSEPPLYILPLILTSVLSLTVPHPLSLHSSGQGAILGWFN